MALDQCYMCKKKDELVDHLLLHCEVNKTMWDDFFARIGLSWIMHLRLVDFLASWTGFQGKSQVVGI